MSHRRATSRPARHPRRARPLRLSALASAGLAAGFAVAPTAALAAGPVQQAQLLRVGTESGSRAGSDQLDTTPAATPLGDVNGDGRDDFALAVTTGKPALAPVVRVVFGSATNRYADLDALGAGGFTIRSSDTAGITAVAAARDFDGDGLRDLVVSGAGSSVVYGDRSGADVDVAAGGSRVTRLEVADRTGRAVRSLGDFDGDGRDDLVLTNQTALVNGGTSIVLGGARTSTVAVTSGSRAFQVPPLKTCTAIWWSFSTVCTYAADVPRPVGDLNGDGKTDLVLEQETRNGVAGKLVVLFGRAAAGGTTFDVRKPTGAFAPLAGGGLVHMPVDLGFTQAPGTDVDADGLSDLWGYRTTGGAVQYGYVAGRTGTGTIDVAAGFRAADPAAPLSGFTAGPPLGGPVTPVGDLDGDGDREGLATWTDYADDAPASTDPDVPRGAVVVYADGPDRVAPVLAPRVTGAFDPQNPRPGFSPAAFQSGTGASNLRARVLEDLPLTLAWKNAAPGQLLKTETTGPKVERAFDGSIDGAALPAGRYALEVSATDAAGNRSTQTLPFEILAGGSTPAPDPVGQTVGPLSQWKTTGAAKSLADGSVELTSATPTVHGEAYWPTPITAASPVTTIEFDAEMTGGSPVAGGGLTVAFTKDPPGQGGLTPGTGSSLGFAPRTGLAVALQAYRAVNADPSANFVGLTFGAAATKTVSLKWVAAKALAASLRGRTVHVKVELTPTTRKVWIDGALEITSGGNPVLGYLQFTASTGPNQNQRHVVKNVKVTQTSSTLPG